MARGGLGGRVGGEAEVAGGDGEGEGAGGGEGEGAGGVDRGGASIGVVGMNATPKSVTLKRI